MAVVDVPATSNGMHHSSPTDNANPTSVVLGGASVDKETKSGYFGGLQHIRDPRARRPPHETWRVQTPQQGVAQPVGGSIV